MGSLIIEIPMEIERSFRVEDEKLAEELLRELEQINKLPFDDVLGIWKNREESESDLNKKLRRDNNTGK